MFKKTVPFAAALLGMTLTAAPAFAKDVAVTYGDLDLTTPEGQKILEARLDKAARAACDYDRVITGTMMPSTASQKCYREATQRSQDTMAAAIEKAEQYNRLGG